MKQNFANAIVRAVPAEQGIAVDRMTLLRLEPRVRREFGGGRHYIGLPDGAPRRAKRLANCDKRA